MGGIESPVNRRLTYRRACPEVVGGVWKVLSYRGRRVMHGPRAPIGTGIYEEELTTPSPEPHISR
jgi:hypothetical protein